jgi:hypothetical protein
MRLRLFDRVRTLASRASGWRRSRDSEPQGRHRRDHASIAPVEQARWPDPPVERPVHEPAARHSSTRTATVGGARARIKEAPAWYQVVAGSPPATEAPPPRTRVTRATHQARVAWDHARARLPFAPPHAQGQPPTADGRRHCGVLETILWRQWDPSVAPPPDVVSAIDRLAEFPRAIKDKLVAGLDAIYVGPGGVPELDDMTSLRGVPLPSGRASWDACAGAYGERKIVIGTRPSPTPDVTCHEVGHALDDLDSPPGKWQSDSAEFRMLYDQCKQHLLSDFHRQPGGLGRKEFFADAFAAIASSQRPALVDMLGGQTRMALHVMLYFNRRYGL